ncbi:hypothetical protein XENTR_v10016997 [Xenopus tropicalis]|nr:hypothetical protein XENTR_v10016997 [Xenopus tropicalis]
MIQYIRFFLCHYELSVKRYSEKFIRLDILYAVLRLEIELVYMALGSLEKRVEFFYALYIFYIILMIQSKAHTVGRGRAGKETDKTNSWT